MKILTIPGYLGSDKKHWQSYWDKEMQNTSRVEQKNLTNPEKNEWLSVLNDYIKKQKDDIILVAHSLGCILLVHWAYKYSGNIKGALLVSPSDVESKKYTPDVLRNFSPIPKKNLPFKSIVIASENDTYVSISRAKYFARCWGAKLVNVGALGHINTESNLGSWQQGKSILKELVDTINN